MAKYAISLWCFNPVQTNNDMIILLFMLQSLFCLLSNRTCNYRNYDERHSFRLSQKSKCTSLTTCLLLKFDFWEVLQDICQTRRHTEVFCKTKWKFTGFVIHVWSDSFRIDWDFLFSGNNGNIVCKALRPKKKRKSMFTIVRPSLFFAADQKVFFITLWGFQGNSLFGRITPI